MKRFSIIIIFAIILSACSENSEEKKGIAAPANGELTSMEKNARVNIDLGRLSDISKTISRLESFNISTKSGVYKMVDSIKSLSCELYRIGASEHPLVKDSALHVMKELKQFQVVGFPVIRDNYAKLLAKTLWEDDIYVNASGTNHEILNLTGAIFVTNKNIKEYQDVLNEVGDSPVIAMRFKKVTYSWYKGQGDKVVFDIPSFSDSTLQRDL